jgi:hypothetical protein
MSSGMKADISSRMKEDISSGLKAGISSGIKSDKSSEIKAENKELTIVVKTDGKLNTPVIITILPVLSMLIAILPDSAQYADVVHIARTGGMEILSDIVSQRLLCR